MPACKWTICLCAVFLAQAACSRSPQQREARFLDLGKRLLEKKDYARAGLEFRKAIQAAPADPEPYYELGVTCLDSGNRGLALSCFRKVTELNPKHAAAQLKLAGLLAGGDDPVSLGEAESRARSVVKESPSNAEALNTLALTELRLGRPDEAAAHLEEALDSLPGDLESAALLMRARLSQGQVQSAEGALLECYRKWPHSAELALVMGRFYLVTHRPQLAEAQFRRALGIDAQYGPALLDLGMMLFHTAGRRQEAGAIFKQASALPGRNYKPVYAIFLLETGRRDEAISELERLAKADPRDRTARTRLVKIYLMAGRRANADQLLAAGIKENPKDVDALMQRAELCIDDGRYQDAQNDLNQVMRFRPDAAMPHFLLARLAGAQGRKLAERQELAECIRLDSSLLSARLDLARLLIASNGAAAALEILRQAPAVQQRTIPFLVESNWALMTLGRVDEARKGVAEGLKLTAAPDLLLQDGLLKTDSQDYAGARNALDRLFAQNPEDVRGLRALMQLYVVRNQRDAGLQALRVYAARRPNSAPVQNFLGETMVENGLPAEARSAFTRALSIDPGFQPAQLSLARLDASEGRLQPARQALTGLLARNPNDPELWLYMGWLDNLGKDYSAAQDCYRKVVDADPSNVVALNNLAYLLATETSQYDEALKYAQQVKQIAPENPGVDDTIGWIMFRKGLYRSAVEYLEIAAKGEADPVVRYHLGMAYLKLGDKRAGPILRAALKSAPDLPEAKLAEQLLAK